MRRWHPTGKLHVRKLEENFQFIFLEQRHSTYYKESRDYSDITMDTIVDDIEVLQKKLGFNKVYVLGHSIAGLIALEYARKYPQNTLGVMMIKTPPHFNINYFDIINDYWAENASDETKKILEYHDQKLQTINRDSISAEKWNYLYYVAQVPKDWYDPLYDVSYLYANFRINRDGWNHFYSFMRDYDFTRSQIQPPIFLSLSRYDFMVSEYMWEDYIDTFSNLTIYRFDESGHYPHVEQQNLFDKRLLDWINSN